MAISTSKVPNQKVQRHQSAGYYSRDLTYLNALD